jgi:hypothetical protein
MPAFIFEKISPPLRRAQNASPEKKQRRSVIVKILDRFGRSRRKPGANAEPASAKPIPKS